MRACLCSIKNVSLHQLPTGLLFSNFNRWYVLVLNPLLRSYVISYVTQAEHREERSSSEERNAIKNFEQLVKGGRVPSTYVILSALKACSSLKDVQTGIKIRSYLRGSGGNPDVNVGNTLVHMFSKCGNMVEARSVFDELPQRSVVSWNAVIFGYAENGQAEEALELFGRMSDEGFEPNEVTYTAALKACAVGASKEESNQTDGKVVKLGYLRKGEAIQGQLAEARYETNVKVATSLVDMYAKCGSMSSARKVFDNMREHSLVSWNSLIFGYAENGGGETALQLFATMQGEGFKPDARTFVAALKACSSCAEADEDGTRLGGCLVKLVWLEKGMAIHAQAQKAGEGYSNAIVANSLLHMYLKCGTLLDARRVFDSMPQRSVITWNSVIFGYAESGEGELALQLLASMQDQDFSPNAVTYLAALKACIDIADNNKGKQQWCLEQGRAIHSQAAIYESDIKLSSTLVDMYAKCGSISDACRVFNRMQSHDVVAWNALILGYTEAGRGGAALQSFATMQQEGEMPDGVSFISALKACGSLARLETGREVHAEVKVQGLEDQLNVMNSLVDFYGKCGAMRDAQLVFDSMRIERDLVTWNSLISGYAQQGDTRQVFEIFSRMRKARVQPNDITFLCMLKACNHAGLVDKGKEYFDLMRKKGSEVPPTLEHYTCMVDMLGRASHLEEAVKLLREMPFEADKTIWTTVLSSSRKWKNVEIAKLAFESISRLEHHDSGPYVLMSDTLLQCFM